MMQTEGIVPPSRRSIWLSVMLLLLGSSAVSGESSALLWRIRFAHHDTFSRVVFDLRKDIPYRLVVTPDPTTIVVEFPSFPHPPEQLFHPARDPIIEAVRLVVTPTGMQGKIILKQPARLQRLFHLQAPYRIVVDIAPETDSPRPPEPAVGSVEQPAIDVQRSSTLHERLAAESAFWHRLQALGREGFKLGPVSIHPGLELAPTYDDNIFLTTDGTEDDFITVIKPSVFIAFPWRIYRFRLAYEAEVLRFVEHDSENTFNQAFYADLEGKFPAGLNLRLRDRYLDTHDPSSSEAESRTGPRTPRKQNDLELSASYAWRPKIDLDLVFLRTDHHYDRASDDALNYHAYNISLTAFYRVLPKTSVLWGYRFKHTTFTDLQPTDLDKDNNAHAVYAGLRFDPTAKVAGALRFGYTIKRFHTDFDDVTTFIAAAALTWTPRPKTSVALSLTRNIEESSTQGASSFNATSVELSLQQRLMRGVSVELGATYEQDDFNGLDRNDEIWGGRMMVQYAFRQGLQLSIGYEYDTRDSNESTVDYAVNRVWLLVSAPEPFTQRFSW